MGNLPFFFIINNTRVSKIYFSKVRMKNPFQLSKTDGGLLHEYRENNNIRAFEELLKKYSRLIFNICCKYLINEEDSKDATIEIFEKLLFLLKQHHIANFKSWVYVVTKNHCLMKKRQLEREGMQLIDPSEFDYLSVELDESQHHNYIESIKPEELTTAINQLKDSQRICIRYLYYLKKTYKEIATLTGFDIKQVKSHIQNGKRNLKNYLTQDKDSKNG